MNDLMGMTMKYFTLIAIFLFALPALATVEEETLTLTTPAPASIPCPAIRPIMSTVHHIGRGYKATFQCIQAGNVSAFADGGGGLVTVTAAGHKAENDKVIFISSTTNYDGDYVARNVSGSTFQIEATWAGDDATGRWGVWVPKTHTYFQVGTRLSGGTNGTIVRGWVVENGTPSGVKWIGVPDPDKPDTGECSAKPSNIKAWVNTSSSGGAADSYARAMKELAKQCAGGS